MFSSLPQITVEGNDMDFTMDEGTAVLGDTEVRTISDAKICFSIVTDLLGE